MDVVSLLNQQLDSLETLKNPVLLRVLYIVVFVELLLITIPFHIAYSFIEIYLTSCKLANAFKGIIGFNSNSSL